MSLIHLSPIICFILVFSFGYICAQRCGDNMFFTPDGTYDTNRRLVLSTIASNVTSGDGFYNVSVGEGSGRIYALGLCIPGTDPTVCSDCIQISSNMLQDNCINQTDARNWYVDKTVCLVRYSNTSFFNLINLDRSASNSIDLNVTGDLVEYKRTWEDFMARMISEASSSTLGLLVGRHYAANIAPLPGNQSIYALMQCIPGLSSVDCEACLEANIRTYQDCCGSKQGGSVKREVCFFQFGPYPFFNAFGNKVSSSPPQISQPAASPRKRISTWVIVAIVVSVLTFVEILAQGLFCLKKRQSYKTSKLETNYGITSPQSLQFDFKTIETATDKFSRNNKVGQGRFGKVYKGVLPNGIEVAVKRLSKNSGQGTQEFKNEVVLVAKLQHRNLVSLLGFCLEGDEQILVYDFVTNKSLDYFLFDDSPNRRGLDWRRRYSIIGGIARGILYLHQDSRLIIIHRDLKASNILLDDEMNPKIADFGMARIFGMDETRTNTSKIAGTFGYMAPEYAMHGQISMKSDVYSFGVLVLEIIIGKKNNSFYRTDGSANNLVTHAWRLWRNGSGLELVDPTLGVGYERDQEVTRCIHIALLCVQENPQDRPMMSTIILMLNSSLIPLQVPHSPGFSFQSNRDLEGDSSNSSGRPVSRSNNDVTVTDLEPR